MESTKARERTQYRLKLIYRYQSVALRIVIIPGIPLAWSMATGKPDDSLLVLAIPAW